MSARIVTIIRLSGLLGLLMVGQVGAAGVGFTYDIQGRLNTAIYDDGNCQVYSYDPNGNRTAITADTVSGAVWGSATWGCFRWNVP